MNAEAAMSELERRWSYIFATLLAGGEVSPAFRLRTEGMMEMLWLLNLVDVEHQTHVMETCYEAVYSSSLAGDWGQDWQQLFPFPQIPAFGQRAPVYSSTNDTE
jgi:hypothetical protein